MRRRPRRYHRRLLLAGLAAGLVAAPGRRRAEAGQIPGSSRLLLPGPEGSALALWGQRLAAQLARGLAGTGAGLRIEMELLGGPDGVTAANRFATAAAPDGRSLLLLPGAACQARLVGDPRAHFDPTGWLPVCAAVTAPALLAARMPLPRSPLAAPLRLALATPDHAGTVALLALDLLGIAARPVLGLSPAQAEAALAQGAVDAAVLQGGPDIAARLAALGARPWFPLGGVPGTMGLAEMVGPTAPRALQAALDAAGAALRLPAVLVLPPLTPADLVALWRSAAQRWVEEETRSPSPDLPGQPVAGPEAAPLLGALAPPPEAMQAYRDWLRQRLQWRPT